MIYSRDYTRLRSRIWFCCAFRVVEDRRQKGNAVRVDAIILFECEHRMFFFSYLEINSYIVYLLYATIE